MKTSLRKIRTVEWILILLYFFFNSLYLPYGLLYTTILTPFFIWYLWKRNVKSYFKWFAIALLPFAIQHCGDGANVYYYARSSAILFSVVVFCIFVYYWMQTVTNWDTIMKRLSNWNVLFLLIAIWAYYVPHWTHEWWYITNISVGINNVPRLKLLTYEASYYSLLLVPVFLYVVLSLITVSFRKYWWYVLSGVVILVLSYSMGVIACLLISFFVALFFVFAKKWGIWKCLSLLALAALTLVFILWLWYIYFPDSTFIGRIINVFTGKDTSFKGRTSDSFFLAEALLDMKNRFWGVGLGQIKYYGHYLWEAFYNRKFEAGEVAIPNAMAETMAIFGYLGLFLRLAAEIFLFFYTKVYVNYYRIAIFVFVFIYQLSGSYIFNVAEYVLWVIAFSDNFHHLDFRNLNKKNADTIHLKSKPVSE